MFIPGPPGPSGPGGPPGPRLTPRPRPSDEDADNFKKW